MTDRELFRRFYGITRNVMQGKPTFADDLRMMLAADAARAGFSNYQILLALNAAISTVIEKRLKHREPSKQSIAIQLTMHTFGRVTKGAKA